MSSIPAAIIPAVFRAWVQHPEKPTVIADRLRDSLRLMDTMFRVD